LLGHHPLRPVDSAVLNRSFLGLLNHAVLSGPDAAGPGEARPDAVEDEPA